MKNYEEFALPYKIAIQPKLSIAGVIVEVGPDYGKILKYYAQNIKFMINFDFNLESELLTLQQ